MRVGGKQYRTVWLSESDMAVVCVIDQRKLPFRFQIAELRAVADVERAIRDMWVRGAGLIGATAGWGMYLAARAVHAGDAGAGWLNAIRVEGERLKQTRPTAVNLAWAVDRQLARLQACGSAEEAVACSRMEAEAIADEDAAMCRRIGEHGLALIRNLAMAKPAGEPVNILTHCNAGWLAFVDHGTATAPIYAAHDAGIPVHVWVDETRPRNQGARLTAWELAQHGVPHTLIVDNAGGRLMQTGAVDMVITGTDRTTRCGDVANKIGTYLKAVAAQDNAIPFYVALPSSTFDWRIRCGEEIPIEERGSVEVTHLWGVPRGGQEEMEFRIVGEPTQGANPAFDITPARLVTGLITERGICAASEESIGALFPELGEA
jgi:methylthioribose-1-phosphate isomerase